MEKKIIDILLKHSSELKIKNGIMAEPETEDWLWSGEFEKVAQEIVKLFAIPDVVGRSELLKAFADWLQSDTANLNYDFKDLVDEYLKSL